MCILEKGYYAEMIIDYTDHYKNEEFKSVRVLLTIIVVLCCCQTWAAEPLVLVVGHWPPHINQAEQGGGTLTQSVQAVYKALGVEVEVRYDSWAAVVKSSVGEEFLLSYGWIKNDERAQVWHFSDPIDFSVPGLWVRTDFRASVTRYSDLAPYLVGVGKGYSYGNEFEKGKEQFRRADFLSEGEGFRMLVEGRISVLISERDVGQYYLSSKPEWAKQVYFLETPLLKPTGIHLVCSKKSPKCAGQIAQFNQGLRQVALAR